LLVWCRDTFTFSKKQLLLLGFCFKIILQQLMGFEKGWWCIQTQLLGMLLGGVGVVGGGQ
jgi:hypothetical protein